MNDDVKALTVCNYAGSFLDCRRHDRQLIASWNGSTWSALGAGTDGSVLALTVYGGKLIAGEPS
jgi:hypothetical protein